MSTRYATGANELVDTSAADQAWWDMDVPCTTARCEAKATHLVTFACDPSHRSPHCERHAAGMSRFCDPVVIASVECTVHGGSPFPVVSVNPL